MISVIILSYNEEKNIERCLKSVRDLTDDIIIIDSGSTDSTLEICKRYNCQIHYHKFINQAKQFNWALDNVNIKYDWVLRLDCDEVIPNELKEEIKYRVGKEKVVGYYLNRRMYWMNKWLKHGRMYPHYIVRLFKKTLGRYEDKLDEHLLIEGKLGYMYNDFWENNGNNSLEYFTYKHLLRAENEIIDTTTNESGIKPKLFGAKPHRTRWLKLNIYTNSPLFLRCLIYFLYRYFICLGFLDGKEGLIWHILQGFWYRFYIDSRIYEVKKFT